MVAAALLLMSPPPGFSMMKILIQARIKTLVITGFTSFFQGSLPPNIKDNRTLLSGIKSYCATRRETLIKVNFHEGFGKEQAWTYQAQFMLDGRAWWARVLATHDLGDGC
jgi:hypothetical protein